MISHSRGLILGIHQPTPLFKHLLHELGGAIAVVINQLNQLVGLHSQLSRIEPHLLHDPPLPLAQIHTQTMAGLAGHVALKPEKGQGRQEPIFVGGEGVEGEWFGSGHRGARRKGIEMERSRLILAQHLQAVEAGIEAIFGQEVVMAAGFHQMAVIEDEDAIDIADRRKAVGDDDGGAID